MNAPTASELPLLPRVALPNGQKAESPTTLLSLNGAGELDFCVITGGVSAKITDAVAGQLELRLELSGGPVPVTTATLVVGDEVYAHTRAEDLEVVLGRLAAAALPHQWDVA